MLDLTSFLRMLPGIKPNVARRLVLEGPLLTPDQRRDIHDRNDTFLDTALLVGPDAAAAILDAYRDGKLPLQKASMRPSNAPDAASYVADRSRLDDELAERRRLDEAASNIQLLTASDLHNYRLLDQVFISQLGTGEGTLVLAGHTVTKSLARYSSNSGKSHGWSVSFTWTDATGTPQKTEKVSSFASNRRNDEGRNWGLPE